jgi:hypothetical protein
MNVQVTSQQLAYWRERQRQQQARNRRLAQKARKQASQVATLLARDFGATRVIASELNGGTPSSFNWHKRLLERMTVVRQRNPHFCLKKLRANLKTILVFAMW